MIPRSTLALAAILPLAACAAQPRDAGRAPHPDIPLASEIRVVDAQVPAHATLESLLLQNHLAPDVVQAAVVAARTAFDPKDLRADEPYKLVLTLGGMLREFRVQIDADRFLRIDRGEAGPDGTAPLEAQVVAYEKHTRVVALEGRIDEDHPSLIAAMDTTGEQVQLALALADVFSGQLDFDHDLQQGDTFRLLFEKSSHDGQFSGYGAILGATFENDGRTLEAFRWTNPDTGKAGYYDRDGRSLKRFFLASPLKFTPHPRITSGFSRHRFHPIYRQYRAHLGIDYGAHTGDPVVAVANGVVLFASRKGANGNMVHLRHPSGFETYYLHLSAFAKGIHPGAHVSQGELIGRVGMTGAATGPHLDFRLKKNGVFINPLEERRRMPPGEPIPALRLADFRVERDRILGQLSTTVLAEGPAQKADAVKAARQK
ncbi:MAG TPA: M23 family metallopeptidase [Vicinamibacterales bacterium]|nr:M23 family metallopeptidase [Vicinamibacterales bacterium]